MPKPLSFVDEPSPEKPEVHARILIDGWLRKTWRIEGVEDRINIAIGSSGPGITLFARRYIVKGMDLTLELDHSSYALEGAFHGGGGVRFSRSISARLTDSFLLTYPGRFTVGDQVFAWTPVPFKARLLISAVGGPEILEAHKPWRDSDAGATWTIKWLQKPEDPKLQLACLVAPWAADLIAFVEQSSSD